MPPLFHKKQGAGCSSLLLVEVFWLQILAHVPPNPRGFCFKSPRAGAEVRPAVRPHNPAPSRGAQGEEGLRSWQNPLDM